MKTDSLLCASRELVGQGASRELVAGRGPPRSWPGFSHVLGVVGKALVSPRARACTPDFSSSAMRRQGSQVSMHMAKGSVSLLSSHGRGIRPQDALKTDS